jgi:hypothetical protein
MPKEQIEKTIIILNEDEVRQVVRLARQINLDQNIFEPIVYRFMREVIAKKVEAALRMRCG